MVSMLLNTHMPIIYDDIGGFGGHGGGSTPSDQSGVFWAPDLSSSQVLSMLLKHLIKICSQGKDRPPGWRFFFLGGDDGDATNS